jgi:hypothetical protein
MKDAKFLQFISIKNLFPETYHIFSWLSAPHQM